MRREGMDAVPAEAMGAFCPSKERRGSGGAAGSNNTKWLPKGDECRAARSVNKAIRRRKTGRLMLTRLQGWDKKAVG